MPEWGAEALSIAALFMSLGVGLLHYVQTNRLQGRLAEIETDRRRDEQTPRFEAAWRNGLLGFRYLGPVEPLERCFVRFPANTAHVRYPLRGVVTSDDDRVDTEVELALRQLHDEVRLPTVPANDPTTREQALVIEVDAAGEHWRVPVRFKASGGHVW